MESAKIRPAGKTGKRPEDISAESQGFHYYLMHTLLFILKIAVFLILFLSLQNISDILRTVPVLNGLAPFPALLFSYFCIHIFCAYFFIVWFGSFTKFFRRLGPTLIEIRGLLIYLIVVPVVFALASGGIWWSVSRVKLAAFLSIPFQWLPDLIQRLYGQGLPFAAFAGITAALLLVLLFLVVVVQSLVDKKPAAAVPVMESSAGSEVSVTEVPVIKEKYVKPLQPEGQPPLEMKK
jgi:hypothetical protein